MASIPSPFPIEDFLAMVQTRDDLGVVLRADFMLEKALAAKCEQIFPKLNSVYERVSTSLCCNLMEALQIPDDVWLPCKKVSRIRNEFAHGRTKKLKLHHASELAAVMADQYKGFANPDNIRATNQAGEIIPLPDELKPQKLYVNLVGLQYGHVLSTSGFYSARIGFDSSDVTSQWSGLKFPKQSNKS